MALIALLAMCISLFIGTVLVGHIPLTFKFSQQRIQDLSTYGGGLLLGAALCVVIPEGIEALYDAGEADEDTHQSTWVAGALLLGYLLMYMIDEAQSHAHVHVDAPKDVEDKPAQRQPHFRKRSGAYTLPRRISNYNTAQCQPLLTQKGQDPLFTPNRPSSEHRTSEGEESSDDEEPHRPPMHKRQGSNAPSVHEGSGTKSISTTIGLIAHSLADGISLGASSSAALSSSSGVSLDVVVFLAIIIHKAPAAFGLTSVLLGDGWSRGKIRQALILFAAAAPLGAVGVYFILKTVAHLGGKAHEEASMKWWTGFALLVSGGTFLFVAAQVTQEHNPSVSAEDESAGKKWKRVSLTAIGILTPMALRLVAGGHGH